MALFVVKNPKDNTFFSIINNNEKRVVLAFKSVKMCIDFRTLLHGVHKKKINQTKVFDMFEDPYIIEPITKKELTYIRRNIGVHIYNEFHNTESVDYWLMTH
jgi:hypothetical protein